MIPLCLQCFLEGKQKKAKLSQVPCRRHGIGGGAMAEKHIWDDPKHYLQRCLLCDLRKRLVKYCGDGSKGYRLVWEYREGKGKWAKLSPGVHVPDCLLEGVEAVIDLDKVKVVKARCEGRGYFLRAPREPWDWDVDTVRVDCPGCPDCKPRKKGEDQ